MLIENKYVQRQEYFEFLKGWKDKHIIKVITGVRRSGKSTLLFLFRKFLLNSGVDKSQIISINFEDITRRIRCFQPDRFGKTNPIDSESGLAADGRLSRTADMPREFALG